MDTQPDRAYDPLNIPDSRGLNLFDCDAGLAARLKV